MRKPVAFLLAVVMVLSLAAIASAEKYGQGLVTTISNVADAGEKSGTAQVNTLVCSLVLDDEGKIVSALFDMQQTKIQFSAEGKVVDLPEHLQTKDELGANYGMAKASSIGKDWFEQADAFGTYCVGKTPAEVLGMAVYAADERHPAVPDVPDLKTSVTISVGDFLQALEKAAKNAI
mgnify:CR=1 FL=1